MGENNLITGGTDADQFWLVTGENNLPTAANIITDFDSVEGDVIGLANTNLEFGLLDSVEENSNVVFALLI